MKRVVSTILLVILLTSMLYSVFKIVPAEAAGTIYIRADGSIDPPTAPIQQNGDVYTLTGDINSDADGIVVERDNIVVDGAGYTVQGTSYGAGLSLSGRSNVTIKSMTINAFYYGILLSSSSSNSISGNTIANNGFGITLFSCSGNSISGNNITEDTYDGIWLYSSSNSNSISGNNITKDRTAITLGYSCSGNNISGNYMASNNGVGIAVWYSSDYNSISGNDITANIHSILLVSSSGTSIFGNRIAANNESGIYLVSSSGSSIFHNNFINNAQQVYSSDSVNVWDDGYPSGGNYWSDYGGIDEKNGLNQDQPGSDGIGDAPYIIDVDDRDRYPLMIPWVAQHDVAITNVASCKTVVSQGYSLNMNVTAANQGSYIESFFDVYMYASNLSSTYQIGLQTITLNPYETAVLTFTWDTHGLAKGNYTLWAYAEPVVNETETADNTYTDGIVTISTQGDINADSIVDIFDIVIVALEFGHPPPPIVDLRADVNNDGIVDIFDIVVVALHFGETG